MRVLAPTLLAASAALLLSGAAHAGKDPSGLWYDHDGRGAVEVAPCDNGRGYCGFIVHIKNPKNASKCGVQILGDVTPGFGGWIYSPSRGRKFDVAVTRLSENRLRVVGNAGHFISKTFVWERAPDDVERCGKYAEAAPEKVVDAAPAEEVSEAEEAAPAKPVKAKPVREAKAAAKPLVPAKTVTGALMQTMKPAKQMVESEPEVAPKKAAATKVKTAAATELEATDSESEPVEEYKPKKSSGGKKCKFKIPYIGRTIMIPCR